VSLRLLSGISHPSIEGEQTGWERSQVSTGLSSTSSWPYPFSSLELGESQKPDPCKITLHER